MYNIGIFSFTHPSSLGPRYMPCTELKCGFTTSCSAAHGPVRVDVIIVIDEETKSQRW